MYSYSSESGDSLRSLHVSAARLLVGLRVGSPSMYTPGRTECARQDM